MPFNDLINYCLDNGAELITTPCGCTPYQQPSWDNPLTRALAKANLTKQEYEDYFEDDTSDRDVLTPQDLLPFEVSAT